jgi:hypothetical protein
MEKTLWKKEPTYVLTTLGDERYFIERPDLVEKYLKEAEGMRAFMVKQSDFVKDDKDRIELWINDNRDDFIQYYLTVSNMDLFLNVPKNPPDATGGIIEVPFNSVLDDGEGSFMRAKIGIDTVRGGSFVLDSLCIVCNADIVDTVKIGIIKKWQEDLKDEELQKHKEIQEKVARYFIEENHN